jgi:hypothetical protein
LVITLSLLSIRQMLQKSPIPTVIHETDFLQIQPGDKL